MKFASLFAGVGGIELGLERAGLHCTAQVEIDEGCRKVLAHHWPDALRFDDVRNVKGADLGQIDGIAGGFPCQDISLANPQGQGLEGARSGLWFEYQRLIEEAEPLWVLVENVHRGWRRWVPTVRQQLADLGFRSEAFRLRASDFGAWHERARSFVIAAHPERIQLRHEQGRSSGTCGQFAAFSSDDGADWSAAHPNRQGQLQPQGSLTDERGWAGDGPQSAGSLAHAASLVKGRVGLTRTSEFRNRGRWPSEPSVARVVHGLSRRVDKSARRARERALGNSVVPACAEWCGWKIRELCYGY